jgi:hypothetical protein
MMRNPVAAAAALWILAAGAAAQQPPTPTTIDGFGGLAFGQAPQAVDWLLPAPWEHGACGRERVFYSAEEDRRYRLGGAGLVWPGLLYRFLDGRLYAVEADFPPGDGAFARLQTHLRARYGVPASRTSWEDAPADSFVYRQRLRALGWHDPQGGRSIWLMAHDGGGTLTVIDNGLAGPGMGSIDHKCAPAVVRVEGAAAIPD